MMSIRRLKITGTCWLKLSALIAALCLLGGVGCSDDSGGTGGQQITPDAGPEPDAPDTSEPEETRLDRAASLEVNISPTRPTYRSNTVVQLDATIYDGYGEPMGVQSVKWSADPDEAATAENPGYRLNTPGPLTFRACTTDPGVDGEPICGFKRIIVRDESPDIEITSPEPGAWLGADGATTIPVTGQINADFGDLKTYINGQKVEADDSGKFSAVLTPHFGINHIEAVVSDGLSSSAAETALDVLWAPAWYDTANTSAHTAFSFTDALVLDLGQLLFDDGHAPSQPDESTWRGEDLADILSLLISHIDFMEQIPNPLLDSDSAELSILSLSMGEPAVGLELTDTGAELFVWVPDVEISTEGEVNLDTQSLNLDGAITTDMAGFATLTLEQRGEEFFADIDAISLSLQNAESAFDTPEANALFKLAESALRLKVEEVLADTLREQFIDQLPELLTDALNSIEEQLASLSFDLETEFTSPLTIDMGGSIAGFETRYRDALTATLEMEVTTDKAAVFTHSPGIPLTGPHASELPLFKSSSAQVAVRLALLNGLLHSLWESGFLELDLTDLMPEQYAGLVQNAQLSAKLQPVLTRPRAGEPYDFILSAGQMEIETEMLAQVDTHGVNIEVGILMSLEDNAIALTIPDPPRVRAWTKSTSADEPVISKSTIETLLIDEVWPQLESTLSDGLAFNLPVPSFDGLADFAPAMSGLDVAFLLARPVSYRDGFIIFDIKLDASLPLAP